MDPVVYVLNLASRGFIFCAVEVGSLPKTIGRYIADSAHPRSLPSKFQIDGSKVATCSATDKQTDWIADKSKEPLCVRQQITIKSGWLTDYIIDTAFPYALLQKRFFRRDPSTCQFFPVSRQLFLEYLHFFILTQPWPSSLFSTARGTIRQNGSSGNRWCTVCGHNNG